jgi:ADP-dependent NAD(P)H-hydrate dehydratase / NAD(P)H-hydrate epimerase
VIGVHNVRHIRLAESELMARLPRGALMQRAATALAATCARVLGGPYGANVALLVGAGDNGGDALYAGSRLARRGARVDAVLVRPDRAHAGGLTALRDAGGRVSDRAVRSIARADLVIDGMLGIGGRGGLRDDAARLAEIAEDRGGLVIAVDLPSGIDPDTGETPGPHVRADLTVTFGARKIGLVVDPAASAAGHVVDADIGLGPYLPRPEIQVLDDADVARLLPAPGRDADKYRRGVVGVLAGSPDYTGAAVLSVGGAVRGGAGMVRYPGAAADAVRARWPEVVASPGRVQAWVIGPGLGEAQREPVAKALAEGVPVVVDADGLRHLPSRFDTPALLTPHAGELARLLGRTREEVEARRLHFATEAARRWDATVLLKGSTTLVAAPDGQVRVNPTGTPALATAGSGDVLAGLAGSLLASGLGPLDAGSVAAYVHGTAGRLAAADAAYPSAADVLDALPRALHLG